MHIVQAYFLGILPLDVGEFGKILPLDSLKAKRSVAM